MSLGLVSGVPGYEAGIDLRGTASINAKRRSSANAGVSWKAAKATAKNRQIRAELEPSAIARVSRGFAEYSPLADLDACLETVGRREIKTRPKIGFGLSIH